ncbi:MAG: hypothetical protein ABFD77_02465, partial [Thermotogota bacterium]
LLEAISETREKTAKGTTCPCCGRFVKLYKRKLHAEMAAFLCRLVRKWRQEPRYYSTRELCPALTKSATDGSYLVLWGLIERDPIPYRNRRGGNAGMYAPSARGIDFVEGTLFVPFRAHILCGELVGFSAEQISIRQALGDKFNYDELMGSAG